jgi:hypothetical protein
MERKDIKDNNFIKSIIKQSTAIQPSIKLVKRDTWVTNSYKDQIVKNIVKFTTGKK